MEELRVGVVGAGWGGGLHLEGYKRTEGVRVVALASRTRSVAEKVAKRFDIPYVYTDYKKMMEEQQLDIVSIATPPPSHFEITMTAIDHGIHVLCDKPLAMNVEQGERMVNYAQQAGIKTATGFIWRQDPAVLAIRDLIQDGYVGKVLDIHCRCALGIPVMPMNWQYLKEEGGGSLMQHGAHVIDRAHWLLGEEIVEATGEVRNEVKETFVGPRFHNVSEAFFWNMKEGSGKENLPKAPITADTGYHFLARFKSGAVGLFWESWHSHDMYQDRIEIHGTEGTLIWEGGKGIFRAKKGMKTFEQVEISGSSGSGAGEKQEVGYRLWGGLVSRFVGSIQGQEKGPFPTLEDGLKVMKVIEAVSHENKTSSWIRL